MIWVPNGLQMKIPGVAGLAPHGISRYSPKSNMAAGALLWSSQYFSMGDKSKILFPTIGFSYPGNSKKNFCHPGGSQWAPGGLLARFRANNAYFGTNLQKNQIFLAF